MCGEARVAGLAGVFRKTFYIFFFLILFQKAWQDWLNRASSSGIQTSWVASDMASGG